MTTIRQHQDTLGIVVSGGPAPGINSVISAATIEAYHRGWRVVGLVGGFQGACLDGEPLRELQAPLLAAGVSVHLAGGALEAGELDAKRAIDQGTRLAARL